MERLWPLTGREQELATIGASIRQGSRPRGLVLAGGPGVGKTGLGDLQRLEVRAGRVADCLRVELSPWGIEVVLVEPGPTDTDPWRDMMTLLDEVAAGMSLEHREPYTAHLAGQRASLRRLQQRTAPASGVAAAVSAR